MQLNYSGQGRPVSASLGRFTALKPTLAPSPQQASQSQTLSGSAASALSSVDMAQMMVLLQKLNDQVEELTLKVAG